MKTIGKLIKETRLKKRCSLARLEKQTKIRKEFLEAIERENWGILPELPVLTGFVRNIGDLLGISGERAVALLRRDYLPRPIPVNPKPDIGRKLVWSPQLTFLLGMSLVSIFVFGYLALQYIRFISPPRLKVFEPKESQAVTLPNVKVSGMTDPDATLNVNNQPVLVGEDGRFDIQIEIFEGTNEIVVKAISRSRKETIIRRKIVPELK